MNPKSEVEVSRMSLPWFLYNAALNMGASRPSTRALSRDMEPREEQRERGGDAPQSFVLSTEITYFIGII